MPTPAPPSRALPWVALGWALYGLWVVFLVVAGRANVLIAPDLEAGNMLAKSLTFLANADAAGIVLGARVPVILTSRADAVMTRLASCAVANLLANARRRDLAAKGANQ